MRDRHNESAAGQQRLPSGPQDHRHTGHVLQREARRHEVERTRLDLLLEPGGVPEEIVNPESVSFLLRDRVPKHFGGQRDTGGGSAPLRRFAAEAASAAAEIEHAQSQRQSSRH